MNIEKMVKREQAIIKEINNGKTDNLNELLEIATNFGKYYVR